jgi:transcriptional regulator with XRE-family HTH domain
MNDQIKDIGMRLACLRDDMEISTSEMAEKLGVDEQTYIDYENGVKDFSFSFMYNAAEILGVDVLDIISGDAPKLSMCCMVKSGKGYSVKLTPVPSKISSYTYEAEFSNGTDTFTTNMCDYGTGTNFELEQDDKFFNIYI